MGEALRGAQEDRRIGRRAATRRIARGLAGLAFCALTLAGGRAGAQDVIEVPQGAQRFDSTRFTFVAYPGDALLARSLLAAAVRADTFPGLPRPKRRAVIAIAPDEARFREWVGPYAPEWGSAIAFPASGRIILQGSTAGSRAGDPHVVLQHELAHLALFEYMGDVPPRWFDEGYASYAAGEWNREQVLAASLALALRRAPTLEKLDSGFIAGAMRAEAAYALAYRAVAELAAMDRERGLTVFFREWRQSGRFDAAVRAAYGITAASFEERYRRNTRRRFGALALATDLSVIGGVMLAVLLPLYISRRRRDRLRLEKMRAADAAAARREQQESERAIEELLNSLGPRPPESGPAGPAGTA